MGDAHFTTGDWQSLLKVTVATDAGTDSLPPVQGRYALGPPKVVLDRTAAPCKWPI